MYNFAIALILPVVIILGIIIHFELFFIDPYPVCLQLSVALGSGWKRKKEMGF